jgi:hypothetical protein
MVNDIEKLSQVIGSLEEQSTRVIEFNGILASVNEARLEIESSKTILKNTSAEHQQFSTDVDKKYDGFLKNLGVIEKKIADLEQRQDECLQKISDLNFLTPEKFDKCRKASDSAINESMKGLAHKIDEAHRTHLLTFFGILVLAAGIAFFVSN